MNAALKATLVALRRRAAGREVTVFHDDLFIVSYPRSGNTWLRFLLGNLLSPVPSIDFANLESHVPDIYVNRDSDLRRLTRPRILKSHEYFDPRYPRIILIVRDPHSVLCSYYRYLIKSGLKPDGYSGAGFVEEFLAGSLDRFGSWQEHTGSWLGARSDDDRMFLTRYEDLQATLASEA